MTPTAGQNHDKFSDPAFRLKAHLGSLNRLADQVEHEDGRIQLSAYIRAACKAIELAINEAEQPS